MIRALALVGLTGCFLIRGNDASCPQDRTIAIATQDDVAAFAGCTHARDIAIRTGASVDLGPLAKLEAVDGDLVIGPTVGLEEVGLNGLEHVGGAIRASDNAAMHGLYLPRLIDAGRVVVDGNPGLRTIAMPRIAAIHGPLVVADNPRLQRVYREIASGVMRCRDQCRYFSFCRGGAPANKLAELGSFDTTDTLYSSCHK